MVYPYEFIKISFGGNVYGDKDIWTCALNYGHPDSGEGFESGALPDALPSIALAIQTFFQSNTTKISSGCDLRWVKMAFIGKDGLYFREPTIYDFTTPITGGDSTKVPAQQALAVTFESDKFRAPGKNARIFLPLYAGAVGVDGYVSQSDVTYVMDNMQLMLGQIEQAIEVEDDTPPRLIVASQKTLVHNTVTKIKVGRVIDTQRRRRNKFQELYVGPVPVTP